MIYPESRTLSQKSLIPGPSTSTDSPDYEMDTLGAHGSVPGGRATPKSPSSSRHGQSKRNTYVVGVVLLLIVVLLWTASGFVTQILYRNGYDKPFLVTYISTGPYALFLVPRCIRWLWSARPGSRTSGRPTAMYQQLATSELLEGSGDEQPIASFTSQPLLPAVAEKEEDVAPLTVQETARVAFAFCWLWFIANWAINAALNYTTVASSAVVASTSGFFTLGIGRIFGVERLSPLKVLAVFICFMGVVLVSLSDSQSSDPTPSPASASTLLTKEASQPLLGDVLAFVSALFYALYVVFLKVKVQVESRLDMQLFLGFLGLFDLLTCWPVGVVLHWVGLERFKLPSTSTQWYALLANMVILVLSDYLYFLSLLKTTPLLVTIGLSLTIPAAVIGDFILNASVRGQVIIGATFVLISFVAIGLDGSSAARSKASEEEPSASSEV